MKRWLFCTFFFLNKKHRAIRTLSMNSSFWRFLVTEKKQKPKVPVRSFNYICFHLKTNLWKWLLHNTHKCYCSIAYWPKGTDRNSHSSALTMTTKPKEYECYGTRYFNWPLNGLEQQNNIIGTGTNTHSHTLPRNFGWCAKSTSHNFKPFLISATPKNISIRNCGFRSPSIISLLYNRMTLNFCLVTKMCVCVCVIARQNESCCGHRTKTDKRNAN